MGPLTNPTPANAKNIGATDKKKRRMEGNGNEDEGGGAAPAPVEAGENERRNV